MDSDSSDRVGYGLATTPTRTRSRTDELAKHWSCVAPSGQIRSISNPGLAEYNDGELTDDLGDERVVRPRTRKPRGAKHWSNTKHLPKTPKNKASRTSHSRRRSIPNNWTSRSSMLSPLSVNSHSSSVASAPAELMTVPGRVAKRNGNPGPQMGPFRATPDSQTIIRSREHTPGKASPIQWSRSQSCPSPTAMEACVTTYCDLLSDLGSDSSLLHPEEPFLDYESSAESCSVPGIEWSHLFNPLQRHQFSSTLPAFDTPLSPTDVEPAHTTGRDAKEEIDLAE